MIEKTIAAALEPMCEELAKLSHRVDGLQLATGPQGTPGSDADPVAVALALSNDDAFIARTKGAPGMDGTAGAGIDAPQWVAGAVYRKGVHVIANIGQTFVAMQDTAATPGESDHWQRIGSSGFRHRGNFDKDATYAEGDLFVRDFGTFCIVHGEPHVLAGRGAQGKAGPTGASGPKGADGRNGATIIAAQTKDLKLVLVQQDADGHIDHLEMDFTAALQELVHAEVVAMLERAE